MRLIDLNEVDVTSQSSQGSQEPAIDLVAVHGIFEDSTETWTVPTTGLIWLKDLLPHEKLCLRVLLCQYDRATLIDPISYTGDRLRSLAITFIHELQANRQLHNAKTRPIVFLCHGLGGLLVKSALVYAKNCSDSGLRHLQSIYVSTYALIFMATPHGGMNRIALAMLPKSIPIAGPSRFLISLLRLENEGGHDEQDGLLQSDLLQDLDDQFAPLSHRFKRFYFWEQRKSLCYGTRAFLVPEDSAVPKEADAECSGIDATHSDMVKFSSLHDPGYSVLLSAISRYSTSAPRSISRRWSEHEAQIKQEMEAKARELYSEDFRLRRADSELASPIDASREFRFFRRTDTDMESPRARSSFFQIPLPAADFTGRSAQVKAVSSCLGSTSGRYSATKPAIFVIHGLGGSGKTQVAKKFAIDNKHMYWGGFWVDASSKSKIETELSRLSSRIGKGQNWDAFVHWLSKRPKPWLLILDNVDSRSMDLEPYLPSIGNGHIIITTRLQSTRDTYATAGSVQLKGMAPDEAVIFLLQTAYPTELDFDDGERAMAASITSELGYLALAIRHAGTFIRKLAARAATKTRELLRSKATQTVAVAQSKVLSLEEYLRNYLGSRKKMLRLPQCKNSQEIDIQLTWEDSFRCIAGQSAREYKDAVDLVHLFAFMHFDSIPANVAIRAMLRRDTRALARENTFEGEPLLVEAEDRVSDAIVLLADYSIVEHDTNKNCFSLHPVVHQWARERLDKSDQKLWLDSAIAVLSDCISPTMEPSRSKDRQSLLPHVDTCLEIYKFGFKNMIRPLTADHCEALSRFALVLAENGFWAKAKELQILVIGFKHKPLLGFLHEDTLAAERQLGEIQWNLFEIEDVIWNHYRIWRKQFFVRPSLGWWLPPWLWKPEHINYCKILSDLTRSLWLGGELALSQRVGERAVAGMLKLLGEEDPLTLTAKFNLARTYMHLGKLEEAHEMLSAVLDKRQHFFGPRHLDTLMAKNEVGMVLCKMGKDIPLAESLVRDVLQARTEILGEEHAYTLWSINDYAKILCAKADYAGAARMLEDIEPIVSRTLGATHVGMAMTRGNLAEAYALGKNWAAAELTLLSLIKIAPASHPQLHKMRVGLGRVRIRLGKLDLAEADAKAILEGLKNDNDRKRIELYEAITILKRISDARGEDVSIDQLESHYRVTRPDSEEVMMRMRPWPD